MSDANRIARISFFVLFGLLLVAPAPRARAAEDVVTRRTGRHADLWVMDPSDPAKTDRMVLEGSGEGWAATDWSPDGKSLFVLEFVSVNETRQWLVDVATRKVDVLTPGVWYLLAKDEGHGFSKKKNQDFQFLAMLKFVDDYLLK